MSETIYRRTRVDDEARAHGDREPERTRGPRIPLVGLAVLFVFLLCPLGLVTVLDGPVLSRLHRSGDMVRLLHNITILGAATVLRYEWQLSRSAAVAWLSLALGFLAVQNLPFTLLLVAGSELGHLGSVNGLASVFTGLLTVGLLWLAARGVPAPRHDPLVLMLPAGVAVGALRLAAARSGMDPTLHSSGATLGLLNVAASVLALVVVYEVLRSRSLPAWFRRFIVAATVLLTLGASPSEPHDGWLGLWGLLPGTAGAVLLMGAAVGLLRATQRSQTGQLLELTRMVVRAEEEARAGQERAHELTATVTAIAHAAQLLMTEGSASSDARERLVRLLHAEMARLDRMIHALRDPSFCTFALDAVIEPVIGIQQARGQHVRYEPNGLVVRGHPDDLAEVFHILLANAMRHAPGARVSVTAHQEAAGVVVRLHDDGPGISPAVASRLFEWRARGSHSPGSGIGLNLALRLVKAQGGDLRTEEVSHGACFVLTLQAGEADTDDG